MIEVHLAGVSVCGPGLRGWEQARDVLAGAAPFVCEDTPPSAPALLPPNERRRTGPVIRLALEVAHEASCMSGFDPAALGIVFGSSDGDSPVVNDVLEAVTYGARPVSPTQFHNSVHNAAAGYWAIALGTRAAVTCLGCYDDTFAASLLKAAAETRTRGRPVLLCVYDVPLAGPMAQKRSTSFSFGAGFVLAPETGDGSLARMGLAYRSTAAAEGSWLPRGPAFRALAEGNPAGRCLRLLESVALGSEDAFELPYLDASLQVEFAPC